VFVTIRNSIQDSKKNGYIKNIFYTQAMHCDIQMLVTFLICHRLKESGSPEPKTKAWFAPTGETEAPMRSDLKREKSQRWEGSIEEAIP